MKIPIAVCVLLWSFISNHSLLAQTDYKYLDIFFLRDKITIYGELLEIRNDTFFLELKNGNKSYLKLRDVRDVYQYGKDLTSKVEHRFLVNPNILQFDRKDFLQISGNLGFGKSRNNNLTILNSLLLELKYKRRYHPNHFMTASYGLEVQEVHNEALFHPVTIGHESILVSKVNTPFINFNIGYGFAHGFCKEYCFGLKTKGGFRYGVGAGMIFGTGGNSLFKTGLEFVVQHSQEHYKNFFPAHGVYKNSRLMLTSGIMF